MALGTVSWLSEGIGFYLILLGLDVPAGWETAGKAVFILSFATVVGAASTLPQSTASYPPLRVAILRR